MSDKNGEAKFPSVILWSILYAMRPQPDQYPVQGITVEDSMSMVHLVWHEAPVLTASPPGSVLSRYGDAAGGISSGLQPPSRLDGRSDRGLRVFQSTSETAARLRPKQPARELVFLTDTGRANLSSPPGRRRPQKRDVCFSGPCARTISGTRRFTPMLCNKLLACVDLRFPS
jgi:hypothetical protein